MELPIPVHRIDRSTTSEHFTCLTTIQYYNYSTMYASEVRTQERVEMSMESKEGYIQSTTNPAHSSPGQAGIDQAIGGQSHKFATRRIIPTR